jgi:hypothetical protein
LKEETRTSIGITAQVTFFLITMKKRTENIEPVNGIRTINWKIKDSSIKKGSYYIKRTSEKDRKKLLNVSV